jgi:putative transposase
MQRVTTPGLTYHAILKGNRGEAVFRDDSDRQVFLNLMDDVFNKEGLVLKQYCLMDTHIHTLQLPEFDQSLSRGNGQLQRRYAMYFNAKYGYAGHLFQGPFWSCPLDQEHYCNACRYIAYNPVKAGMVERPEDWPWSSSYQQTDLGAPPTEEEIQILRLHASSGRPLGSDAWVQKLEEMTGRRLRPLPPGPKPLAKQSPDMPIEVVVNHAATTGTVETIEAKLIRPAAQSLECVAAEPMVSDVVVAESEPVQDVLVSPDSQVEPSDECENEPELAQPAPAFVLLEVLRPDDVTAMEPALIDSG